MSDQAAGNEICIWATENKPEVLLTPIRCYEPLVCSAILGCRRKREAEEEK